MAATTIEWTGYQLPNGRTVQGFSFNPWIGCTKVSDGCKHCYAETLMDLRYGKTKWGPKGLRVIKADSGWSAPLQWNTMAGTGTCAVCRGRGTLTVQPPETAEAIKNTSAGEKVPLPPKEQHPCGSCAATGSMGAPYRARVFCASLADVFEGADTMPVHQLAGVRAARVRLFDLIRRTPNLDWLLLTKRPENWRSIIEETLIIAEGGDADDVEYFQKHGDDFTKTELGAWLNDWLGGEAPANVWIGTSVENQETADKRIPELRKIPAVIRFLSGEPLLGSVLLCDPAAEYGDGSMADLTDASDGWNFWEGIHWVIAGGESGPGARPMHPEWARDIRDQCQAAGVPFLFKQWGAWEPCRLARLENDNNYHEFDDAMAMHRVGKKVAGRLLDGREWNEFPEVVAR